MSIYPSTSVPNLRVPPPADSGIQDECKKTILSHPKLDAKKNSISIYGGTGSPKRKFDSTYTQESMYPAGFADCTIVTSPT